MRLCIVAVLALMPSVVWAASTLDPAFCRQLPVHRPADDVAFQPGVDVYGKPVVPADLTKGTRPPLRIEIPLTLGLAKELNLAVPSTTAPQTTEVGRLVLEGGRVLFNGQPLGSAAEGELAVLCGVRR